MMARCPVCGLADTAAVCDQCRLRLAFDRHYARRVTPLVRAGAFARALKCLDNFRQRHKEDGDWLYASILSAKADVFTEAGQTRRALRCLHARENLPFESDVDFQSHRLHLSAVYQRAGDFESAVEVLRSAIRRIPHEHAHLHWHLFVRWARIRAARGQSWDVDDDRVALWHAFAAWDLPPVPLAHAGALDIGDVLAAEDRRKGRQVRP